jgi:hypothetical protein
MSNETAVKIQKGAKAATELNRAADRPGRVNPSNREQVHYNVTEGRGEANPGSTIDQTTRRHELAADSEAKSQGAIVAGKIGAGCVDSEVGFANAERRAKAIAKRRKETEAVFAANRKMSSTI